MTLVLNPAFSSYDLNPAFPLSELNYTNYHIRELKPKVNIFDLKQIFSYLNNNFFDFDIEFPDHIVRDCQSIFNIDINKYLCLIKNKDKILIQTKDMAELYFKLYSGNLINIFAQYSTNDFINKSLNEFHTCLPEYYNQNLFNNLNIKQQLNSSDYLIFSSEEMTIIITKHMILLINNDIFINILNPSYFNNHKITFIIDKNNIYFNIDMYKVHINIKSKNQSMMFGSTIKSFIGSTDKSYNKSSIMPINNFNIYYKVKMLDNHSMEDLSFYKCIKTGKKILTKTNYLNKDETISHTMINRNSYFQSIYTNSDKYFQKSITKCMMSGSDGLRYRGKQTDTISKSSDGSINNSRVIKFNDSIQYSKSNDQVLVDHLTPKNGDKPDDSLIGWKVCKSLGGDLRIVKLFIPAESKKIMPISDDFLETNFKERTDCAIVMDIQEPNIDIEKSVVPDEKIAYSSIYNQYFEYEIGKEVRPDGFSEDQTKSCSKGIHYFRNRRAVFKSYVPGYEDIEIC